MQITHEEAHRLIHLAADESLYSPQKQMLELHLASCGECRQYAKSIAAMESILRPLLIKQWNQQSAPHSMAAPLPRASTKISDGMILATRIAALTMMFIAFIFSASQFRSPKPGAPRTVFASVPPIPIPSTSTELVSTTSQSETCEETMYAVHDQDTVNSIAAQFSVSRQQLLRANHLETDAVYRGMTLVIPLCNFTPTVDALTTTFTPILILITSTPGG